MKNSFLQFIIFLSLTSSFAQNKETLAINSVMNNWHNAAAEANFDKYFNILADDATFIGTDATEIWNKKQFEAYSKSYFDKGKAWTFTTINRNVYFSSDNKTAWFDELLNTQMKICRGSGILVKIKNVWKIRQYVLSMTIPNENSKEVIKIKEPIENAIIEKYNQN